MITLADVARDNYFDEPDRILEWAEGKNGSFLDLGCFDGMFDSNTYGLAKQGWQGVCVDASPDAIAACAELYAHRPDVMVVSGAFSQSRHPVTLHWSPATVYSALSASVRPDAHLVTLKVAPVDLEWLAAIVLELPQPLFCSIDIEDQSMNALEWILDTTEPACVCVEANNPGTRMKARSMMKGWTEIELLQGTNLLMHRD